MPDIDWEAVVEGAPTVVQKFLDEVKAQSGPWQHCIVLYEYATSEDNTKIGYLFSEDMTGENRLWLLNHALHQLIHDQAGD